MERVTHTWPTRMVTAIMLLVLVLALTGVPPRTTVLAQPPAPSALLISEVPIDIYRRAADFLEEMRESPMAPEWNAERNVRVDPAGVTPLYRPDVVDPDTGEEIVAYYEFKVIDVQTEPAGFILLSTGAHDLPIPHWDSRGSTPTEESLPPIEAVPQQTVSYKFYKLDALFYAAQGQVETRNPFLAGYVGTPLVKVSGMQADWLDNQEESAETWEPPEEQEKDVPEQNLGQNWNYATEGAQSNAQLQFESWGDLQNNPTDWWENLKAGYVASYGVLLADLRRLAEQDWEIERQARQIGEVLVQGDVYVWPLLYPAGEADLAVTGAGQQYVDIAFLERPGLLPAVQIMVTGDPERNQPLALTITYPTTSVNSTPAALSETGTFVIAPTNPQELVFLPLITRGTGSAAVTAAPASDIELQGDWGPWTYYWAGNTDDQRYYRQIPANSAPNTTSCPSGCGATSWAMLFGWADKQAADGNAYWAPRWGLYREGGGTGADAVAPQFMGSSSSDGVRRITWEIRDYIDTKCILGNGPTFPWDMDEARQYFTNRTGTSLRTNYNVFGIHTSGLRERARNAIRDQGTPAIIGTGWLNHYPLAWGYAWRSRRVQACFICPWKKTEYSRFFYVNQGWSGSGDGWVSAGTWFAGRISP